MYCYISLASIRKKHITSVSNNISISLVQGLRPRRKSITLTGIGRSLEMRHTRTFLGINLHKYKWVNVTNKNVNKFNRKYSSIRLASRLSSSADLNVSPAVWGTLSNDKNKTIFQVEIHRLSQFPFLSLCGGVWALVSFIFSLCLFIPWSASVGGRKKKVINLA